MATRRVFLFVKQSIDVVVTDLDMDPGHGLVSGTGPAQLEMALNLGARLALPKPADAQRLLAAVEEASSD